MELLVAERKYTVQEFEQLEELDENYYYELIDGEIVQKSSPHFLHQRVLGRLFIALTSFVNEKKIGEVFIAPLDVYLDQFNRYQPDILFVSEDNKHILTSNGIVEGAPDLVVEIISPSSAKYDRGKKMKGYKRHQVAEYWLIEPQSKSVEVYSYQDNDYELLTLIFGKGVIQSKLFLELHLDASALFE